MGIQDRDYMSERGRKVAAGSDGRLDRPFAPPREGPSMLVMVLMWVSVAFLLYRGYEWVLARKVDHGPAAAYRMNAADAHSRQRQAEERPPAPDRISARSSALRSADSPPAPSQSVRQDRQDPPAPQTGRTLYLCRSYNGGTFWAQAHCGQHHALIERIVPVPAGLPFDQQVHLAEQHRHAMSTAFQAPAQVEQQAGNAAQAECKALDASVARLDDMARQPQSGQMQDWIRGQREAARSRQFALRC